MLTVRKGRAATCPVRQRLSRVRRSPIQRRHPLGPVDSKDTGRHVRRASSAQMALHARSRGAWVMMTIALENVGSACHPGLTSCRRTQAGLPGAGPLLPMKIPRDLTTAPRVEGPEEEPESSLSWLAFFCCGEGESRACSDLVPTSSLPERTGHCATLSRYSGND